METLQNNLNLESLQALLPMATEWGGRIVGALVVLIAAFWISAKLKKLAIRAMKRAHIDETLVKFGGNMVRWAVLLAAGISLLGIFGIQTASFAALIAAMGLAIGLAFQGTLSNIASGVMLLVFRPFRVGQVVNVSGVTGTINEIDLFSTTFDTPDNRRIIVPNASVFGATIENISHHETRRVDITVGADYGASLEDTRAVLNAVVGKIPAILKDPAHAVILSELGASSVDWTIRAWVNSADYWDVREKLLVECKNALDRAGIGIPFPQMDVHFHSSAPQQLGNQSITEQPQQ